MPGPIDKLTKFLDRYGPLVEKLAADDELPDKLHNECLELLRVKKEYDKDPEKFAAKHRFDFFMLHSAGEKLNDLSEPFSKELKERTVEDILSSFDTNDWEPVMQDMGLLSGLHKAEDQGLLSALRRGKDSKAVIEKNEQDICDLNNKLQERGWLPEVRFRGIAFQSGKNLQFDLAGDQPCELYIDKEGSIKVILDRSKHIIGPSGTPSPKLRQYLGSHQAGLKRQLGHR